MSDSGRGLQGCAPCGRRLRRPWTPRPLSDERATMIDKLSLADRVAQTDAADWDA